MTIINGVSFTDNELAMLKAFYSESVDCCGGCDEDENMSYMNANDLLRTLGGTKQSIGGTMSSLSDKNAIHDTGESGRGSRLNDWVINVDFATYFNSQEG